MASRNTIEKIAVDVLSRHEEYSRPLKEKWSELYRRYENELRDNSITADTEAKVRLGAAYALVENFTSKIIAQNPRFRYLARERKDASPADMYDEFNEYQHDVALSHNEFVEIAKWGGICGLAGFQMGWKVEDTVVKVRGKEVAGKIVKNPMFVSMADKLKIGKNIKVDETERIASWTIQAIKPHDLIWDPNASKPEDSAVKGVRARYTIRELRRNGYDTDKLVFSLKSDSDYWRKQMQKHPTSVRQSDVSDNIEVEVSEMYVEYTNKNGLKEFYVVTLAGVSEQNSIPVSVRFEQNPFDKQFCPIGFFRPVMRPGKVEGYGIIEPVEGVLDAEEDTFNMNLEAAWTDVSRPMEYVPNNVLNEEELIFKPRTLVPVKRLGESVAVMQTPTPNLAGASYLLSFLEKTKQNVSAITDYQTGANQMQKSQTATEVSTKAFLSEQRLNKMLRSFEVEVLESAGKMALWLNKQFLSDYPEVVYRVLGKKGSVLEKQIKFKDIEAIKDIVVVPGSSAYQMQDANRNKYMALLQLASQEMMVPGGIPMNREAILERLLEEGFFIKDTETFIPSIKDREEATVQKKLRSMNDAKAENTSPETARVLPSDEHAVHIALHKAALQGGGTVDAQGQQIQYSPEQMMLMTSHLNSHVAALGGMPSQADQAIEQAIGAQINRQLQPNEQIPSIPGGQNAGGGTTAGTPGQGASQGF